MSLRQVKMARDLTVVGLQEEMLVLYNDLARGATGSKPEDDMIAQGSEETGKLKGGVVKSLGKFLTVLDWANTGKTASALSRASTNTTSFSYDINCRRYDCIVDLRFEDD